MHNDREVKKSLLIWCAVGYRVLTFLAQLIFLKLFTGQWLPSVKMAIFISVMDFGIYLVYHYYWNGHFKTSFKKQPEPHSADVHNAGRCECDGAPCKDCSQPDSHGA